jgi:hypothetical protein
MADSRTRILIGWREWVSLPEICLPVIKAKVDTGAKTSSLHAFNIEPFFDRGRLRVAFQVHPLHERDDIVVSCTADVVDYRSVSDSGGHREKRYVIKTHLKIGEIEFPIEVTLANRESMTHKMLIGRAAMKQLMIDPGRAFLLGKPETVIGAYKATPHRTRKKKKSRK